MPTAKVLFCRHVETFKEICAAINQGGRVNLEVDAKTMAIIYSACIVASAIQNEMEEPEEPQA